MSAIFCKMGLTDRAIIDVSRITSNLNGFGISIVLTAPNGQMAIIGGRHAKHHLGIDTEGNLISSKTAYISFSEPILLDINSNYPLRNNAGEVDLKGHKIDVKDSTGIIKNYVMQKWLPDETMGLITCIIEDFE